MKIDPKVDSPCNDYVMIIHYTEKNSSRNFTQLLS